MRVKEHFLSMPYYVYPADTVLEILKNMYKHMLWDNCLLIFTCIGHQGNSFRDDSNFL